MATPKLPDISTLIAAGIDPKTGLPLKFTGLDDLVEPIKKNLRILDEQDAINRFTWHNLPEGLNGQMLERILYYKGQAAFFYMPTNETFYFLPYALDGTIDVYGRFTGITPIPMGNSKDENGKDKPWIQGLKRKPFYDIPLELDVAAMLEGCVLLSDYSNQMSYTNISRQILQDPILQAMAEAFPMARTSLLANSGIKAMRVQEQGQADNVKAASRSIARAAISGDPFIPIVSPVEFQDLTSAGTALKSEEYLLYMQALDNFRLSLYGLKNGGLFQKKAHMLEAEQSVNDGNVQLAMQDCLANRQRFCDIVNGIWGLGISVEISEQVIGIDQNGDGEISENQDQSGVQGEQPQAPDGQE